MPFSTEFFFDQHPMFLLDLQSLDILEANRAAVDFYGFSRAELMNMNISDLGRKIKQDKPDIPLPPEKNSDENVDVLWVHRRKNGEEVSIQFTYHDFNYQGKPVKLAVAHVLDEGDHEPARQLAKLPKIENQLKQGSYAIIEWDENFRVKKWSEQAERLFGWSEEEVIQDPDFIKKFVYGDELDRAVGNVRRQLEENISSYTIEGKNYTRDGKVLEMEWYSSLVRDEDDELVSIYSLGRNISERKQSEELFRVLSEESQVGVYLIQDRLFRYVNPRFAQIFGYAKDEIEGTLGPEELVHPDDRGMVMENIRKRLQGEKKSVEYGFKALAKGDHVIHVNIYGTRIMYEGRPAVMGTLVNMTESRQAFERYKASVESFEALFDSISDAIYIQKPDGRFIQVNQGAVDMYGYERKDFIGRTPEFLAAPGKVDMEKTLEHVQKALEGKPQSFRWWGRKKSGEVFPKDVMLNSGTYFGEQVVMAIARDVSDTIEAELEIKKSQELFQQLFQNTHVAIAMLDKNEEIQIVNHAFEELFGYRSEEVHGLDINRIIVPDGRMDEARELSRLTYRGQSADLTTQRITKSGELVDVMIYGVPVTVEGRTIAIFGMYVDITDRKRAEEEVRRSLREKEVLLSEIHHRVKNNLAVITGLLSLQANETEDEVAREIMQESQMRVHSIALIHEKLYQNEDLSHISFDIYLEELVDAILGSISASKKNISVEISAQQVHLTINEAIPCGLILNELLTNAFKHAFEGREEGTVNISLKQDGSEIRLRVEDDGVGFPEGLRPSETNSLGLTLIHTLARQISAQGAFLEVDEGTCYEMTFRVD